MSSRSQRRFMMKNWHISAIVIGIILALLGLYFVFGISSQTNRKNAECTEKTVGTITAVTKSGSDYLTDIDYTIEDIDKSMTVKAKEDLGVGNTIDIYYEPLSWSHIYIEGVSSTGKNDVLFGLGSILVGAIFITMGVLELRKRKSA
ncbi:MAG: hypothetical protein J5509_08290 [Lachnospiraceae bacterium]|nr:hypothetical protein [Lachnospiraceae bacterium]